MPHFLDAFVSSGASCFLNLAIVNTAAVNMGVQMPLEYPVLHSFGISPGVGLLDLCLNF
jgi:hypothetical protein